MGLSTNMLLVAIAAAFVPMAALRCRPPSNPLDLAITLGSSVVTIVLGVLVLGLMYELDFFGVAHLLYLLGVVSMPLLLGGWWLLVRVRHLQQRRWHIVAALIAIVAAVAGFYGTHIEPNWLRVDHTVVVGPVSQPIKIGVIADLQTPDVGDHERNAIDKVLAEKPDLVVIPGDWFQGTPEELEAARPGFVALLAKLSAAVELVVVTSGDSDHAIPLQPMVEEAGALFIDDTIRDVSIAGVPVRLAGVGVRANGPERAETLAALTEPTDRLSLLVAHRPDALFELAPDADIDLVISGHTHGGQVALPFFGPPVTFSKVPRRAAAGGLSLVENVWLYVGVGVGLERFQAPQVRFGVRPSVGVIDVVPS